MFNPFGTAEAKKAEAERRRAREKAEALKQAVLEKERMLKRRQKPPTPPPMPVIEEEKPPEKPKKAADPFAALRGLVKAQKEKFIVGGGSGRRFQDEDDELDAIIRKAVKEIWHEFDEDGSGELDYDETKKFIESTLSNLEDQGEFSDEDFAKMFKEFDKDGSGTIEMDEMAIFIKKIVCADTPAAAATEKPNTADPTD
jgi:hypothetical protein